MPTEHPIREMWAARALGLSRSSGLTRALIKHLQRQEALSCVCLLQIVDSAGIFGLPAGLPF